MNNITIKIIDSATEMYAQYDLIKQLSKNVSYQNYCLMIDEMVLLNYKQAVAYLNNKPVGVCGYWINTKIYAGKYVELDNVVTDENYRGKKIGALLCNFVLKIAKENYCKTAMLDAYLENESAHSFYQNLGFDKKGYHFIKSI
ncbi:MAG: GNAT family N-acetyltransferase [Bacteroidota bacterium]|jgi:GNAT superfamily N-acetyltransferase